MIAGGKLVAFDEPEKLEKNLTSANELTITTDATEDEVRSLFAENAAITEITFEKESSELVVAHLKTDLKDIYALSRIVFSAFAENGKVLLEMKLKKANLEDIFIELTETADQTAESTETSDSTGEPTAEDGQTAEEKTSEKKEEKQA
jgi:ABC-2 type transport system ATP-binding protein